MPRLRVFEVYRLSVGFGGLFWLLWVLRTLEPPDLLGVALFVVIATLAERSDVPLPEGTISPSYAVLMPAFIIYGPALGAIISFVGFLLGHVIPRRREWPAAVFNLGQLAICLLVGGGVYTALGGEIGTQTTLPGPAALAGFVVTYFVINHVFVGAYLSLRHGSLNWKRFWVEPARVDLLNYVICVPIATAVVLFHRNAGPVVAATLYVALFMGAHLLRLNVRLETVNQELAALYRTTRELTGVLREEEVEKIMLRSAAELAPHDTAILLRWDRAVDQLVIARLVHPLAEELRGTRVRLGEGLAGEVAESREGRVVAEARRQDELQLLPGSEPVTGSALAVPLVTENRLVGVLALTRHVPRTLNDEHLRVLTILGGQAATALDRALRYQEARRLAITDSKTGIFNYRYFYERLRDEMQKADQQGSCLSVIFLDIDFLKEINDRYGHGMGDTVIQETARIIGQSIRDTDVAARYGGEEFIVVLPGAESAIALAVAERIRRAVEATVFGESSAGEPVRITVSAGIATYPRDAGMADDLIFRADEALYAGSKRMGRNRVAVYSDPREVPS
ncbi:MAG: diguanylate cyclase [bacterium]|nr:diguanylate cyclase [bacterium]